MKLRFFSVVWGEKHLDLYSRVLVRSLAQPLNRAAISSDCVVSIHTDAASASTAEGIANALPWRVEVNELIQSNPGIINPAHALQWALQTEIKKCLLLDAAMIPAGPDAFWGDGSLPNLVAIADGRNVCIAAPHVRVDKERFLEFLEIDRDPINNPELVFMAMRSLHRCAVEANTARPTTNCFHSGLSWKQFAEDLYDVTCLLQTCWYARFLPQDLRYFTQASDFGATGFYDHSWPEVLVSQQRHESIGSSDAFFLAELTETDSHQSPLRLKDRMYPSAYHRDGFHIRANRNCKAIWRAG